MHPCAGPRIIFGLLDDVRSDRITFHIPNCGPQVLFVKRARERASLPQMTGETVFPVKVRGINPVGSVKSSPQRVAVFGNGDDMDVVCHQTVGAHSQMKSTAAFSQQLQVILTVGVVTKHIKPADSTLRDVMWNSGKNNTG
jgi:hypothetical protein